MPRSERSPERDRVRPFFHRMLTERDHAGDDWERELDEVARREGGRRSWAARLRARSHRHT